MAFLGRILRFLFWALIAWWSVALLRRLVNHMGQGAEETGEQPVDVPMATLSRRLVRDPICGLHLTEARALPLRQGDETFYFCSADCRDAYLQKTKQFAASA